ncbi:hypothetical protein PVAP13_5NG235481 [Panicum virgatum]|uniref:Uncharacterized protein n=1 Tax=Panicum virgatum TaxID=38727 RepID=A0A8T0RWR1_PANVG|nr:hypothetical protein PVAP13_5NG235481 [Panicum virgatum]
MWAPPRLQSIMDASVSRLPFHPRRWRGRAGARRKLVTAGASTAACSNVFLPVVVGPSDHEQRLSAGTVPPREREGERGDKIPCRASLSNRPHLRSRSASGRAAGGAERSPPTHCSLPLQEGVSGRESERRPGSRETREGLIEAAAGIRGRYDGPPRRRLRPSEGEPALLPPASLPRDSSSLVRGRGMVPSSACCSALTGSSPL